MSHPHERHVNAQRIEQITGKLATKGGTGHGEFHCTAIDQGARYALTMWSACLGSTAYHYHAGQNTQYQAPSPGQSGEDQLR